MSNADGLGTSAATGYQHVDRNLEPLPGWVRYEWIQSKKYFITISDHQARTFGSAIWDSLSNRPHYYIKNQILDVRSIRFFERRWEWILPSSVEESHSSCCPPHQPAARWWKDTSCLVRRQACNNQMSYTTQHPNFPRDRPSCACAIAITIIIIIITPIQFTLVPLFLQFREAFAGHERKIRSCSGNS